MKFLAISDLHIKSMEDTPSKYLIKFLKGVDKSVDKVFLLGDIFDLVIGNHIEYYHKFSPIFDELKNVADRGIEVHYLEGNHDFHLKKLFKRIFKNHKNVYCHKEYYKFTIDGKECLASHGDLCDIKNKSYIYYIKFIKSKFMYFFATEILSFKVIQWIGDRLTKTSNKQRMRKVFNRDKRKTEIREIVTEYSISKNIDFFICGHCHVEDIYSNEGFTYMNAGHGGSTGNYISYENGTAEFKSLKDSSL